METQKKINGKKVITCGLLAGILILSIGACLLPILGNQMTAILESRGIPPMGTGSMIFFTFVSLVNGIAVIWLYALTENRFESKFKAVLIITVAFWFFSYFLSSASLIAYGFMPVSFVIIGTTWGILEIFVGTFIGAKLYSRDKRN